MSEYPCTGIDKAALKFERQDGKISQIVSVIFPHFWWILFGSFYRDGCACNTSPGSLLVHACVCRSVTGEGCALFRHCASAELPAKTAVDIFSLIFVFY
jgi:hypothetical protein